MTGLCLKLLPVIKGQREKVFWITTGSHKSK